MVDLSRFFIDLDASPDLTSLVGGANRTSILNLDLSNSKIGLSRRQLVVTDVQANLTGVAAGALNSAFSVNAFAAGLDFGTARVQAQVL